MGNSPSTPSLSIQAAVDSIRDYGGIVDNERLIFQTRHSRDDSAGSV